MAARLARKHNDRRNFAGPICEGHPNYTVDDRSFLTDDKMT